MRTVVGLLSFVGGGVQQRWRLHVKWLGMIARVGMWQVEGLHQEQHTEVWSWVKVGVVAGKAVKCGTARGMGRSGGQECGEGQLGRCRPESVWLGVMWVWTRGGLVCSPGKQAVPEPGETLSEVQGVGQCATKCIQSWASLKIGRAEAIRQVGKGWWRESWPKGNYWGQGRDGLAWTLLGAYFVQGWDILG